MSSERPVAGWRTLAGARLAVQPGDFDAAAELARTRGLLGGAVGAIASFIGLVRDQYEGAPVSELYLEHYPGMTEQSLVDMIEQAQQRWLLQDVCVIHRVGALLPTDQIVFVQTAAAHRPDAFAACEFLMDYLKTEAVLWKRERQGEANRWLSSTADDAQRRASWQE
ncbi:MAG: molybdenum cofactor biosynthesis protein MoaE [Pseudomonadales bacterium]